MIEFINEYWQLAVLIALVIGFLTIPKLLDLWAKRKRKKALEILQQQWGESKERTGLASDHYQLLHRLSVKNDADPHTCLLNDNAVSDLDLDDVFDEIDYTQSRIGQQYLYYLLRRPAIEESELSQFDKEIDTYASNSHIREQTQLELQQLSNVEAYFLPHLFLGQSYKRPSWWWVPRVLSWAGVLVVASVFVYPVMLFGVMGLSAVNLAIHYWNKRQMQVNLSSFSQLKKLLNVAQSLGRISGEGNKVLTDGKVKSLKRHLSIIQTEHRMSTDSIMEVVWLFYEYVKVFFLLEINAYFKSLRFVENSSDLIRQLYFYIAKADAAISVAAYREQLDYYAKPQWRTGKAIHLKEFRHPLIPNCVTNDLELSGKSALITGSNMSGKTTFIRSVAINAVLAQTICTTLTKRYEAPLFRIGTSIRIADDAEEGKSYFMEEAARMGDIIDLANTGGGLFVIDEVFKGTNTKERVAAAQAILRHLNDKGNMVLVSTHDLELVPLLDGDYELFHFEERVENGKLLFDHQLKNGALKTTNAIRLLKAIGYPESIIEAAQQSFK